MNEPIPFIPGLKPGMLRPPITAPPEGFVMPTYTAPFNEIYGADGAETIGAAAETMGPASAAEVGALAGGAAIAGAVMVGVAAIAAAVVIKAAISADNDKRAKFTLQFVTSSSKKFPQWNVVICHPGQKVTPDQNAPNSYVRHRHIELGMSVGTCGYDVYYSPMGKPFQFVNQGDGGYINWAYYGQFNRNGNTITAA
jgi:hypothetical protein